MAISIRGGTPLVVVTTGNPISGTLTATRQPQAGDLLVIIHGNDFYDLTNMPTPTVGGSTTGVAAVTNGSADAGSPNAHNKVYVYPVSSTGDLTVSITETGSADEDKMIVVYVLSGADTVTPIDGGSSGAAGSFSSTGTTTLAMTGVTPSGADAFLIAHANSGGGSSAGTPYTTPGTMTELYDTSTGGLSYVGAIQQLAASGATGTRTFTGTGSTSWAGVLVAIKTASAGTAAGAVTASATGAASDGTASVGALAGQAAAAGSAFDAAVVLTVPAGQPGGVGTAPDSTPATGANTGLAGATATAFDGVTQLTVNAAQSAATAAALSVTFTYDAELIVVGIPVISGDSSPVIVTGDDG